MSSFPLLNLPFVALRNVVDYWNPIDWYKFSKISGKTKKLTKSIRKAIDYFELKYGKANYITLKPSEKYEKPDIYEFRIGEIEKRFMNQHTYSWAKNPEILSIPSENPKIDVLNIIEEILEIFKCQLTRIFIYADGLTDAQFNDFIIWTNSLKQQSIEWVRLETANKQYLENFLQNFKKPTENLYTQGYYSETSPDFSDFHCYSITNIGARCIGLKQLYAINFVSALLFLTPLTNRDVNMFFKSWKNCKAHSRMKKCTLEIRETPHSQTILEGLSPEGLHRNRSNQEECRIRRDDGKIAKIMIGGRLPKAITIVTL